jgi:two-component system CheB/CheR fusion protein
VWVAGCATGEEAFSIAMTLVEYFDESHTHRQVQIFATDVSEAALERARTGIYPVNISADVSAERLRRFFVKNEAGYQVTKSIRDMCVFARQNLMTDPPFSNVDLITCRNVLIYFGATVQKKLMPVFHYALQPNGWLLLGNSETIGGFGELFSLVDKKHKLFAKRPEYASRAIISLFPNRPPAEPGENKLPVRAPAPSESRNPNLQQYVDRLILNRYSPAAVVINSELEALYFRGSTGHLLEPAQGAASLNLLKMAKESLAIDLRNAVTKAVKQDVPVYRSGAVLRKGATAELVDLEVIPFRISPQGERYFLVVFTSNKEGVSGEEKGRTSPAKSGRALQPIERREVAKLREDLTSTRESLQGVIEEQEATNEELKSANEEIQSSNEELQSTNEELQTAKEELQSTNEELTTLNEELHSRNLELSQSNNDLVNLLSNVNVAVVMVGTDLRIRRFTPMAERIFNLIASDLGRRLSDLNRNILVPDLDQMIERVVDQLTQVEQDVQDGIGRWYSMRIRPYRTSENRIEGAVLTLVDIHPYKNSLEQLVMNLRQPLAALYGDLRVRLANGAFAALFGQTPNDLLNQPVFDLGEGLLDKPEVRKLLDEAAQRGRPSEDTSIQIKTRQGGVQDYSLHVTSVKEEGRISNFIFMALEPVEKAAT